LPVDTPADRNFVKSCPTSHTPPAESALLPGSNDDSTYQRNRESALLPGSNAESAYQRNRESALLPGSNAESA